MPMVDYLCEACGYRFEHFFHEPPELQTCPRGGDSTCYGTAKRIVSVPGEYRPTNAKRFDPIVIWQKVDNPDQFSVPGRADEPLDAGYRKIEITNLTQADYWTKRMDSVALKETSERRDVERAHWDARLKYRRDSILARIGSNERQLAIYKEVCRRVDERRDKRYSKTLDPRGHFQVVSFDSSNREGYVDAATEWRERRS